jgi:hypothetical protein
MRLKILQKRLYGRNYLVVVLVPAAVLVVVLAVLIW